jgi:hypothetical protein
MSTFDNAVKKKHQKVDLVSLDPEYKVCKKMAGFPSLSSEWEYEIQKDKRIYRCSRLLYLGTGPVNQCCGIVTIYGSGSDFESYGYGSDSCPDLRQVTIPFPTFDKLRFRFPFRFRYSKRYGSTVPVPQHCRKFD